MKKIVLSLAMMACAAISFGQKKADEVAKFSSDVINLGNIKQGQPTAAKFIVTNIGKEPLIIEQANPTCGCTVSDYTKSPIMPGQTGYINATYNAAAVGHFDKHLTVKFAGIDEMKSITISGDVVASNEAAPAAAAPALVKAADQAKPGNDVAPVPVKANKKAAKKVRKTAR